MKLLNDSMDEQLDKKDDFINEPYGKNQRYVTEDFHNKTEYKSREIIGFRQICRRITFTIG